MLALILIHILVLVLLLITVAMSTLVVAPLGFIVASSSILIMIFVVTAILTMSTHILNTGLFLTFLIILMPLP